MAYRQPRIPEYNEAEGAGKTLRALILFLKDFTMSAWTANNRRKREIEELGKGVASAVTSVNGKSGEVQLEAADMGALGREERAADSASFDGRTWAQAMLEIYPVGSVFMSFQSTSPAQRFGGTWEQLKDRFLLGAGGSYAAESTGGEAAHTLAIGEMPRHSHDGKLMVEGYSGWSTYTTTGYGVLFSYNKREYGVQYHGSGEKFNAASVTANTPTGYAGSGAAHNNMPPYVAVYMWRRLPDGEAA